MEGVRKLEAHEALDKMLELCRQIDTDNSTDIDLIMDRIERTIVEHFLVNSNFSIRGTGIKLGVLRNTMTMRIRRLGLWKILNEGRTKIQGKAWV